MSTPEQPKVLERDLYAAYEYRQGTVAPNAASDAAALFVRRHLLPKLAGVQGEHVLEIGAGAGHTLAALRSAGFLNVRGVDLSEYQVAAARKQGVVVELANGLDVLAGEESGRLGAILALDVLEHLSCDDYLQCLRLAARALRPGGIFIARVPNGAGLFGGAIRYGDITHQRAFTAGVVRETFMLAGFSGVRAEPVRPLVHGPVSAVRYGLWIIVETGLRLADTAETGDWRGGIFTRNLLAWAHR